MKTCAARLKGIIAEQWLWGSATQGQEVTNGCYWVNTATATAHIDVERIGKGSVFKHVMCILKQVGFTSVSACMLITAR